MKRLERFIEARNTTEGKILSVLIAFVLAFSMVGVPFFGDTALAAQKDGGKKPVAAQEEKGTELEASLSYTSIVYDGYAHRPGVTVKQNGKVLFSVDAVTGGTDDATGVVEVNAGDKTYSVIPSNVEGSEPFTPAGKYNLFVKCDTDNKVIANLEFEITKRPLTVYTASGSKLYDGKPLSAPKGWVENEADRDAGAITVDVKTELTKVGSIPNDEFDVVYKGTIEGNYEVTKVVPGTLTVKCGHVEWGDSDSRWEYKDLKHATCTESGYYEKICKVCGEHVSKTEVKPTGHSFEKVSWVDDNKDGYCVDGCTSTQHKKVCERCYGTEKGGVEYEPHAYGEWEVIQDAGFGAPGFKVHYCKVCGHKETAEIAPIDFYTVTWMDGYTEGVEGKIDSQSFPKSKDINSVANPDGPSRDADDTYEYAFDRWSDPVADENGDYIVTAQWKKTFKEYGYTVNYLEEGTDAPLAEAKKGTDHNGVTVDAEAIDIDDYVLVSEKAQFVKIAPNGENVINFYYAEDKVGTDPANPDAGDNVPDKYQVRVDYAAINGTVSIDHAYVTLMDADGQPAADGTGYLGEGQIAAATAAEGYDQDSLKWDTVPATDVAITAPVTFTAEFSAVPQDPTDPVTPPTDPTEPTTPTEPTEPVNPPTDEPLVPGPTTPTTPGTPGGGTPAAPAGGPGAAAAPAAPAGPAAAAATATIGDDANPLADAGAEEAIADDGNPLGAFDEPHCWVHWLMVLGGLLTIAYGAVVLFGRRKDIHDMDDFEDQVLGREEQAREGARAPRAGYQAI